MASIRRGYSDDFVIKNSGVGINTTEPQHNLDVAGVVKGQDLKVTGISSLTTYEGFLRADHQIAENTTLSFDQGPSASLSGEIIVGTGQTVTVSKVDDEFANANDGSVWSAGASNAGWEDYDGKGAIFDGNFTTRGGDSSSHDSTYDTLLSGVSVNVGKTIRFYWNGVGAGQRVIRINGTTEINGGSGELTPGWDSYYNFKGTINTLEVKSANTGSYGLSVVEIDGEILVDGFSTLVDKGARAGGSEIECLKVYNTFTPPSGGTNERPYAPKPGELYYNYDFKTIEFFDGNGWRQVDNTTRSGRMIYGGTANNPYYQVLHYVNIHTTGNSIDFGSLLIQRYGVTGSCSSNTRGLAAGGWTGSSTDTIEYFTMASGGTAIDFGNLIQAEYAMGSCSSSTRGLFTGSYQTPSNTAQIEYVEIATLGDALDFGDMSGVTRYGSCGLSSPTRGIFAGGRAKGTLGPYTGNAGTHEIDLVSIAAKGNSTDFGDMTFNGGYCGGISNTTRGIIGGARQPATVNNIDMITIASTGNAVHFGDLTVARAGSQTGSTQTRGVFIGGSPTADTRKTIDYITISSSGNAIDFGESGFEVDIAASVSDSHGGLGGF
jgi:hypothetical protein